MSKAAQTIIAYTNFASLPHIDTLVYLYFLRRQPLTHKLSKSLGLGAGWLIEIRIMANSVRLNQPTRTELGKKMDKLVSAVSVATLALARAQIQLSLSLTKSCMSYSHLIFFYQGGRNLTLARNEETALTSSGDYLLVPLLQDHDYVIIESDTIGIVYYDDEPECLEYFTYLTPVEKPKVNIYSSCFVCL